MKSSDYLRKIMRSDLCSRCGSCVGLSEGKIVFTDREGDYRPVMVGELSREEASRLLLACPGEEFCFPCYRHYFYPDKTHFHRFIGPYEGLWTGHATDPEVRLASASGGVLSAILIYLLEKKRIDGAIVTGMSKEEPWLTRPFIATTREEVLEAAQSKYIISSVNEILSESRHFEGRLAYVGLPPQVHSIRKLQMMNDPCVSNIDYIFGPFYGNTLHFSSVKSFLRSHGERDHRQISRLWFRYGEWPGKMRIEMNSGKVYEMKKFHANYLIPFHILRNCLYCIDLTNEFTDISGGDAWSPVYEERGQGYSMVISRSPGGHELISEMMKDGALQLSPVSKDEAITMHSHGYDFKKRGSYIRIRFRKLLFRPVTDYGTSIPGIPPRRYLMELVINGLFLLLRTRPSRWLLRQFSPEFLGRLFERARIRWKKATHNIKRKDLT